MQRGRPSFPNPKTEVYPKPFLIGQCKHASEILEFSLLSFVDVRMAFEDGGRKPRYVSRQVLVFRLYSTMIDFSLWNSVLTQLAMRC